MTHHAPYTVRPVPGHDETAGHTLCDIELVWPDTLRTLHLAGRGGLATEERIARAYSPDQGLPVLVGSGMGKALEIVLEKLREADSPQPACVAVIDKEHQILKHTDLCRRYKKAVFWIDATHPDQAFSKLLSWQKQHGNRPLVSLCLPVYRRIDRAFYGTLTQKIASQSPPDTATTNRHVLPRVLYLTSTYFLTGELVEASKRLGLPCRFLNIEAKVIERESLMTHLQKVLKEFRPDFVFTINHLGLDREGVIAELLERSAIPIASWFVDNPHLILPLYKRAASPWITLFTWDSDTTASLKKQGFAHVHYLPLATNVLRFIPQTGTPTRQVWKSDISFVGTSMCYKVAGRIQAGQFPPSLLLRYKEIATAFCDWPDPLVHVYLEKQYPEVAQELAGLGSIHRKIAYEMLITWEATRQYRKQCLEQILPFGALIAGDRGWKTMFDSRPGHRPEPLSEGGSQSRQNQQPWRFHKELNYYAELPLFYPHSAINFNCTGQQMKEAVNQRIFDIPACGSFVLSDQREQMNALFEPDRESVTYSQLEEIPEYVRFYLQHTAARNKIIQAARQRILKEHTYEHRLATVCRVMNEIYQ